jgi:hypothetical protein
VNDENIPYTAVGAIVGLVATVLLPSVTKTVCSIIRELRKRGS